MRALVDTSVWIAGETGRPVKIEDLPDEALVSVVTVAELEAGVLAASDTLSRSRRLATLDAVRSVEPLPIDSAVAGHWALMRVRLHEAGRRLNVNDLWIGATAAANGLRIVTQDSDFLVLAELGLLEVSLV